MKPTKTLILGLREAAHHLRTKPEEYSWGHMSECNCGILAQCLMHVNRSELFFRLPQEGGFYQSWTHYATCSATGLVTSQVVKTLMDHGLEAGDFAKIEHMECTGLNRENPAHVAAYFDQLADDLEKRRKEEFAPC